MTACSWLNTGGSSPFASSVTDESGATIEVPSFYNPDLMSPTPTPGPTVAEPTTYGIRVGKSMTVDCGGINPSVGYDWQVAPGYDQSVVSVQRVYKSTGVGVGGGGNLKYVVKALAPGETTLTFTYDWRLQTGMIGTYVVKVLVAA